MSSQSVFACPSCGASLSANPGERSIQCQFCGSTVAVPAAMRTSTEQPLSPYDMSTSAPPPLPNMPPIMPVMPVMPAMPVYPNQQRIWRGVMGFNIIITVAVLGLTACITIAALLPFGLIAFPGVLSGLGHLFGH